MFRLIGHEHDLGDGTNLDSLNVEDEVSTREYWLLGISEENGAGLSKGIRQINSQAHAYVDGKKNTPEYL